MQLRLTRNSRQNLYSFNQHCNFISFLGFKNEIKARVRKFIYVYYFLRKELFLVLWLLYITKYTTQSYKPYPAKIKLKYKIKINKTFFYFKKLNVSSP